jgi:hypothetical protein
MQQRIKKHPYLEMFDGADPNSTTPVRFVNTTPLQALFFMNDRFAHEQADAWARRMMIEADGDTGRIEGAYALAFSRPPTQAEVELGRRFLERYREKLDVNQSTPGEREQERAAWAGFARALFASNEFVYVE